MEAKDVMIMKLLATILFFFLFLTGAFAQTRNVLVNTSSVVVQPTNFWSADASNARTGLGLGSAATNPASVFQPSSIVLSNLANSNAADLTNITISNLGTIPVTGGGTGATNAARARTNLSLGASWLTNTNVTNFRSAIGLGAINDVSFFTVSAQDLKAETNTVISLVNQEFYHASPNTKVADWGDTRFKFYVPLEFDGGGYSNNASATRTNLGLSWNALTNTSPSIFRSDIGLGLSALTNTNASNFRSAIGLGWPPLTNTNASNFQSALYGSNTNPVLVNSSGSVVSPTNFWQQAPIQTLVQTFIPAVSSNSYGTNARNLYVYSMATSISGVTNTIILPTNSATFDGDAATITHKGTTSSITAVRQAGSATNFTTISNEDESVKFIREDGQWTFYHNISYVEPIRFTDGNLEFNKATSRTNLGIPLAALTNTNNASFQRAIIQTNTTPAVAANLNDAKAWLEISVVTNSVTNSFRIPVFQ